MYPESLVAEIRHQCPDMAVTNLFEQNNSANSRTNEATATQTQELCPCRNQGNAGQNSPPWRVMNVFASGW